VDLSEIDQRLRELVATIPPEVRAAMLEVPTADEQRRAKEIGGLHSLGLVPAMAELMIDAEEDPALRAVLVGVVRESGRP